MLSIQDYLSFDQKDRLWSRKSAHLLFVNIWSVICVGPILYLSLFRLLQIVFGPRGSNLTLTDWSHVKRSLFWASFLYRMSFLYLYNQLRRRRSQCSIMYSSREASAWQIAAQSVPLELLSRSKPIHSCVSARRCVCLCVSVCVCELLASFITAAVCWYAWALFWCAQTSWGGWVWGL